MAKILLVEDDEELTFSISQWLSHENHIVETCVTGEDALARLFFSNYDVVILDWILPGGISGLDVLHQYRERGGKDPIIMLTGRSTIPDKEEGLNVGADDYLTKPFHMRELVARMKALMRRPREALQPNVLVKGDLVLDPAQKRVTKNGMEVHLLPIDFALLEFFLRHPGQVFSNDALLTRVWHTDSEATADALRSALKRIRQKVDDDEESIIENVPRVGYRLRQ